jgi:hypothetical protein
METPHGSFFPLRRDASEAQAAIVRAGFQNALARFTIEL